MTALRRLLRVLLIAVAVLVGVFLVLPVGAFAIYAGWAMLVEIPRYADEFFDGVVPYDEVLASRRWVLSGEPFDCTFAIVRLAPEAPETPETAIRPGLGWQYYWGGDWAPSPGDYPGENNRDALDACAGNWDAGLQADLLRAVTEPGHWFARDGVGENLYIYSKPLRLAAHIRYGD